MIGLREPDSTACREGRPRRSAGPLPLPIMPSAGMMRPVPSACASHFLAEWAARAFLSLQGASNAEKMDRLPISKGEHEQ